MSLIAFTHITVEAQVDVLNLMADLAVSFQGHAIVHAGSLSLDQSHCMNHI